MPFLLNSGGCSPDRRPLSLPRRRDACRPSGRSQPSCCCRCRPPTPTPPPFAPATQLRLWLLVPRRPCRNSPFQRFVFPASYRIVGTRAEGESENPVTLVYYPIVLGPFRYFSPFIHLLRRISPPPPPPSRRRSVPFLSAQTSPGHVDCRTDFSIDTGLPAVGPALSHPWL